MAEPEPSRRQLIIEAFLARLEAIRTDNGFNTDAGRLIFLNEVSQLGPDDPDDAIVVVIDDDIARWQGEHVLLNLPLDIQAAVKADPQRLSQAYLQAEAVLQDIKRAIELPDRTLAGLVKRQIERGTTRTMKREPGSQYVGVAVTYIAPYTEQWGTP